MIMDWIKRVGSILALIGVIVGIVGLIPVLWPGAPASVAPTDTRLLIASGALVGVSLAMIVVAMLGAAFFGPTGYED